MGAEEYLVLDDAALLRQCEVHLYRASGPGGQHRNKTSSAVRLHHRPTGVAAQGEDARSQHQNKRTALRRLRMNIACRVRGEVDAAAEPPPVVRECMFTPRGRGGGSRPRLDVGRKDRRFWRVGAFLLDVLQAREGRLAEAAAVVGISTANLVEVLKADRHLLAAAQQIRKAWGRGAIR
jgi:hypothetical protein